MFIGHRDGVTTTSLDAMFAELKFTPCYGANHVRKLGMQVQRSVPIRN